ncbi:phytoene/squalene synthase family protein [Deinococcus yavapaiensis]|uniref:Phytoene synthase n=1 Tax=Deinococcus yavapaiensis KR-236 TaxID=694435 RepID=A0A318S6W1_9DEIO|nr:phytoene/squalene synthase family protein [Deinococcus yavapaiensis]PYE54504.1 phytoene synthase [Deinococcus yavapaiensis KR-236]
MRQTILPAPTSAVQHCRDLTRYHSKTFYFGSRFFPSPQRAAVWAVYAACRTGDDIVDEGDPDAASGQLEAWWEGIEAAYAGRASREPVVQALSWAVAHYPIPKDAFRELYLGLRMDLAEHAYDSMADLELYCRRVAGVVGFMIAPISGYEGGDATLQRALKLGQAMQLTNILRDVGEDASRGRVYLPAPLLREFGVRTDDILSSRVTPQYERLMRHLVKEARGWYADGRGGIPKLHGSARLAVGAAASAYEGILDDLERARFDNFNRRAHVSTRRKLMMLPSVWWNLRGSSAT